jgi:hypothetical protein
VLFLIVVSLPQGKNSLVVKINNNKILLQIAISVFRVLMLLLSPELKSFPL